MVSWIVSSLALCALVSVGFSFPLIEEHQEIGLQEPETIVGHEEIVGHQIGLSQEIPQIEKFEKFEPKQATSYQSFYREGKNSFPIVTKTVHPPTFNHFSNIGESSVLQHHIPEEPIGFNHHHI